MFLNLPDRVFFEKEMLRKALQQNPYDFGWTWYYEIISKDSTLEIHWTGNCITETNFIMLHPRGDAGRENKTVTLDVRILDGPSDDEDTSVIYSYSHDLELYFEERCAHVATYHPSPRHFVWKEPYFSARKPSEFWKVNPDFKLVIHPMTENDPSWDTVCTEWSGFLTVGLYASHAPAVIEVPIDKFAPDEEWDFAVVYGHRLGGETLLAYGKQNNIRPVSVIYPQREYEIVLEPGESIWYSCTGDSTKRGFGITYIQFYKKHSQQID